MANEKFLHKFYKERRQAAIIYFCNNYVWNHPNRLATIAFSGSISYTRDGRNFTAAASSYAATRREYTLDFSLIAALTRVYVAKAPWDTPSHGLAAGEFTLAHKPMKNWFVYFSYDALPASITIGTRTRKDYSRINLFAPWTENSSTTTDIGFRFDAVDISDGGVVPPPASSAGWGKGTGADAEKAIFAIGYSYTGTEASFIMTNTLVDVKRLPWVWPWAAESAAFSTAFADEITARNTADGGGHSGTCSVTVTFT